MWVRAVRAFSRDVLSELEDGASLTIEGTGSGRVATTRDVPVLFAPTVERLLYHSSGEGVYTVSRRNGPVCVVDRQAGPALPFTQRVVFGIDYGVPSQAAPVFAMVPRSAS